jgi:hypothetical protein
MANEFTDSCIRVLKQNLVNELPNYAWVIEKPFANNKSRISIDIFGENDKSFVLIEFEMGRRKPINNALKLVDFVDVFTKKKNLLIHVFSPFYEVKPHYSQLVKCEQLLPVGLSRMNVDYVAIRWDLDQFPMVRKKCQNLDFDNPLETELKEAISALTGDLKVIVPKWDIQEQK